MLVFQDGKLDEEVETGAHYFKNGVELGNSMARFAAMNQRITTEDIGGDERATQILEPRIARGIGPKTVLVIKEVILTD